MTVDGKAASAVGGKTARACDSCARRRARWFCAADDAFLCQSCDTAVHAANRLASRHDRVRLQTSSFSVKSESPKWLTRKARTPRSGKASDKAVNLFDLPFVPEMSKEESNNSPTGDRNEEEQEGVHQVPVFDPFALELCMPVGDEDLQFGQEGDYDLEFDHQIQGFLQSEMELAEFTADVESLLGVDDRSLNHNVKGFELMDDLQGCKEEDEGFFNLDGLCVSSESLEERVLKVEEADLLGFEENPNCGSEFLPETAPTKRDILLRLNYEAVIAAWDSQGSPWTTGIRPEVKPENGWPDFMDMNRADLQHKIGNRRGIDGGREARVSRYREKRRVRLFSKKIRYEVRKLNAEKRPRMKGRFVKRTSLTPTNNINKTIPSTTTFPNYNFMKQ